jgi:hypothetical protein
MNDIRDDLAFSEAELDLWARHHRDRLAADVRRTSPVAARLLAAAGIGPEQLLALSERVVRDPDWNTGFLNRCAVVIRDAADPRGRLGAWEERGALCVEAEISPGMVLVARGPKCTLTFASHAPQPAPGAGAGAQVRGLARHEAIARSRARVCAVQAPAGVGPVTIVFGTRTRPLRLAAPA